LDRVSSKVENDVVEGGSREAPSVGWRAVGLVLLFVYLTATPLFYYPMRVLFSHPLFELFYYLDRPAFRLASVGWVIGLAGSGFLLGNGTKKVVLRGTMVVLGASMLCVTVAFLITSPRP